MKSRILIILLIASLLLNAAGLVFFFLFLESQKHYKAVRRERNELSHELSLLKKLGALDEILTGDRAVLRPFISQLDGQEDVMAVLPPVIQKPRTDLTLVVYLHGMGSNCMEPFSKPKDAPLAKVITSKDPSIVIVSCNYRQQASFGNDQAIADLNQNIKEICQQYPIQKIVLMGTSMGGCVCLNYATCAQVDIKSKIVGIVSAEGAGDLKALFQESSHPFVQEAMITALGGTPEQVPKVYFEKSFLSNIKALPPNAKIAVISAVHDTVVPPHFQQDIVKALEQNHVRFKLIELNSRHTTPPGSVYLQGLDFVLSG